VWFYSHKEEYVIIGAVAQPSPVQKLVFCTTRVMSVILLLSRPVSGTYSRGKPNFRSLCTLRRRTVWWGPSSMCCSSCHRNRRRRCCCSRASHRQRLMGLARLHGLVWWKAVEQQWVSPVASPWLPAGSCRSKEGSERSAWLLVYVCPETSVQSKGYGRFRGRADRLLCSESKDMKETLTRCPAARSTKLVKRGW
jgi:hypothetical protein